MLPSILGGQLVGSCDLFFFDALQKAVDPMRADVVLPLHIPNYLHTFLRGGTRAMLESRPVEAGSIPTRFLHSFVGSTWYNTYLDH